MWRWAWSGASNKNQDMFIWLFVGNPFRGHLFQENVTLQTVQQQLMREQTLGWRCSCTGIELTWCRSWCFYHLSVTSEDLQWCKAANARARWAISATTGRRAATRWGDGPDRFSRAQSTQSMVNRVWWNNSMEHMNDSSIDINARQKPNMLRTSLQRFEVQTPNLLSLFFACLFWLRHADPVCEPLKWCIVGKDGRGIGVQGLWKVVRSWCILSAGRLSGPGSCLGEKVQGATGWSLKMSESLTENSELRHIRPLWTSNLKRTKLQQRCVKRRRHSTLWILVLNQTLKCFAFSVSPLTSVFQFCICWDSNLSISLEEPLREDWGLLLQAFAHWPCTVFLTSEESTRRSEVLKRQLKRAKRRCKRMKRTFNDTDLQWQGIKGTRNCMK